MRSQQTGASNPWLPWGGGRIEAAHRIYCFAHAGGSAGSYSAWRRQHFSSTDWVGVELPGRGAHYGKAPINAPQRLISCLLDALQAEFNKGPFALFGHSLGGLLAFHLARTLEQRNGPLPTAVFISAASPGHVGLPRFRDLPTPQFLDAISRLNGTPHEVMVHSELVDVLLPALRADVTVAELLREQTYTALIQAPIMAFSGNDDTSASVDVMRTWHRFTCGEFSQVTLPGDHFYIREQDDAIREAIVRKIGSESKSSA